MDLEAELNECLEKKNEIIKRRGRLLVFDKIAESAGVVSVCAIPISLVALIPLGAAIGVGIYVNKKDAETYNEMCELNYKCRELENEITYNRRVQKIKS